MENYEFSDVYAFEYKTILAFRHDFINTFHIRQNTALYLFIKSDEMHLKIMSDRAIKYRDVEWRKMTSYQFKLTPLFLPEITETKHVYVPIIPRISVG